MLTRAAFYSPFVLHPTRAAAAAISKLLRTTETTRYVGGREGAAGVVNQANENRFLNDIELIFCCVLVLLESFRPIGGDHTWLGMASWHVCVRENSSEKRSGGHDGHEVHTGFQDSFYFRYSGRIGRIFESRSGG
jgi:hypothetical protein